VEVHGDCPSFSVCSVVSCSNPFIVAFGINAIEQEQRRQRRRDSQTASAACFASHCFASVLPRRMKNRRAVARNLNRSKRRQRRRDSELACAPFRHILQELVKTAPGAVSAWEAMGGTPMLLRALRMKAEYRMCLFSFGDEMQPRRRGKRGACAEKEDRTDCLRVASRPRGCIGAE
jgi:hypothetical protein